jgi:O-antigen ligase
VLIYYDIADSMVMYSALFVLASYWLVRRKAPLGIVFLSVPLLFSLLFSYRRGAWLACMAGALVLAWMYRSQKADRTLRARWLAPAVLVASLAIVGFVASNWQELLTERLASIGDVYDDTSNVFRIMDALNALTTFSRHPILGLGSGGQYDFEYYSEAVAPAIFWENASRACHNGYVYVLFKMGIFGFIAYLSIVYCFVRRWLQLRKRVITSADRIAYYALGTGVIAILVNNLTSPVPDSLRPALLLAALMACVGALMMDKDRLRSDFAQTS